MADDHTNSASIPVPSDPDSSYTYRPLGLPSLASPGAPLPGHKVTPGAAARAQAFQAWKAEQDHQTAKNAATARADKAPARGKKGK